MKTVAVLAGMAMSSAAMAAVYTDAQNDLFNNGFAHLDIANVAVSHSATTITFDVEVRGNLNTDNWGKVCIGINTGAANPDSTNGWGRNISWGSSSINYWIGTWCDSGSGGEVRQMTGANNNSNNLMDATYNPGTGMSVISAGSHQIITFSRASIGFVGNGTFTFDVITTANGGGDPGVDHLSRADLATTDWSVQSTSGQFLSYTIPSPGSLGLMGLASLAAVRRRR